MVVILIIAILIAVAIPMFLAARTRSQDRAALTKIRYALGAEKSYFADVAHYTADPALLAAELQSPVSSSPVPRPRAPTRSRWSWPTTPVYADGIACVTAVSSSGTTFMVKDISKGTNAGTWSRKTPDAGCDQSITGYTRGFG